MNPQLDWQDGFQATIDAQTALSDSFIKLTQVPTINYGFMVLEDNTSNYEVVHFSSKTSTGINVDVRNIDGTSTGIHVKGARVRQNMTAADMKAIRDYSLNIITNSGKPIEVGVTSASTLTPAYGSDITKVTAQATALTVANPSGSAPTYSKAFMFRFKDNGTAQAIGYGSKYRGIGVTLPSTTVVGKTMYLAGRYNVEDATMDVLAIGRQG